MGQRSALNTVVQQKAAKVGLYHDGRIIREVWPEVDISLSHQVALEFREFERTSYDRVWMPISKGEWSNSSPN